MDMNEAGGKSVVTPRINEDLGEAKHLDSAMASQYRSRTMRLNYLAQDRADVQFAGKITCKRNELPH